MHTIIQTNSPEVFTHKSAFTVFLNRFYKTFNDVMQNK